MERTGFTSNFINLLHPKVIALLFLGFSAGVPILLIFSTLSLWLNEAGVQKSAVTMFSWAALGYSFKFVWAPIIDQVPVPVLTRLLGRRRGWLIISQIMVIASILLMAFTNPSQNEGALVIMAVGAVLLGFSSATQDIVIDAYRIEAAPPELQGIMSSTYIAGYRIGMIVAGAGGLYLASYFGTTKEVYNYDAWRQTYVVMAFVMLVGVLTTFIVSEPENPQKIEAERPTDQNLKLVLGFIVGVCIFIGVYRFLGPLTNGFKEILLSVLSDSLAPIVKLFVGSVKLLLTLAISVFFGGAFMHYVLKIGSTARTTWIAPFKDLFARYGIKTAWLLLCVVGLYRISDIVLGVSSNLFYQDLGFSKIDIANAVKTYGVIISIVGGLMGGLIASHIGVFKTLVWGAIISCLTNMLFVWLAYAGKDLGLMYFVVSADNLAAGFASAAFVAFLSALTNIKFTAVQYAVLSSIMTLLPKTLGGYSGGIIEQIGYPGFFVFTTLIGLPVIWLTLKACSRLD